MQAKLLPFVLTVTVKLPATVLVRALGWDTNESILDLFWNGKTDEDGLPVYDERIVRTLEKDTTQSADEALVEIYKKLRPGELLL